MAALDVFVRPLEPLFFGPTHSINAGENHHMHSLFPPPISACQGLIRTRILHAYPDLDLNDFSSNARKQREEKIGTPDRLPEGWQLNGPFPAAMNAERVQPWLPVPRALFADRLNKPFYAYLLDNAQKGIDDLNANLLGRPRQNALKPLGGWCSSANLSAFLFGEAESNWQASEWGRRPHFVVDDRQAGLALDRKDGARSVNSRHGMLYFQKRLRLKPGSGFLGGVSAALPSSIVNTGLAQAAGVWGRKSRPVELSAVSESELCPLWRKLLEGQHLERFKETSESAQQLFWLVTLTPVFLDEPTQPLPRINSTAVEFECLAALPGPPVVVGGYNLVHGSPRANRKLLPAGSAWLFRLNGGDVEAQYRVLRNLNNAFPLGPIDEAAFGYGHTFVGIAPIDTDQTGESL